MLNSADNNNSFSDLVSVYLKVSDHLIWIFLNILEAYSNFKIYKIQDFGKFEFSPMYYNKCSYYG